MGSPRREFLRDLPLDPCGRLAGGARQGDRGHRQEREQHPAHSGRRGCQGRYRGHCDGGCPGAQPKASATAALQSATKADTQNRSNGVESADDVRTVVRVTVLGNERQRLEELAQLAGGQSAEEAIAFAESLLTRAANVRQTQQLPKNKTTTKASKKSKTTRSSKRNTGRSRSPKKS